MLSEDFVTVSLRLPLSDGRTQAWLTKVGDVLSKQYNDDHLEIHVRLPARHAGRLTHEGHQLQVLAGELPKKQPDHSWKEQLPTAGKVFNGAAECETQLPNEEVA